jgi:hypothetical protein
MKNDHRFLILTLFVISILGACKKSSSPTTPPIRNNLLYIYQNDSTDGVSFKTLLQNNGCSVTLLDRSKAGAFNYSSYNMVIIGNNTDTLHSSNDWSPTDAMTIKNTGKPILLIGEGGLLFAEDIGDTVNWRSSAGNSLTGFKAMAPASALYKQPKTISVGADSLVTIYSSASKVNSFYAKSVPVPNVVMIGMETDAVVSKYYSISITNAKFGAFGFYSNVNAMTAGGKDFFVNLVYYVGNLTL